MASGSAASKTSAGSAPDADDSIGRTVRERLPQLHADLDAWLRIPSISADPAHAEDVRASAAWLVEALRRTGFPTVEVWETPGHPSVFAEWPSADPAAPTVVLYGHHDVQPVDPIELWHSPPFEPTVRGEELFARGAIDDKGQVLFHLLGLTAHLETTGRSSPAINLKLIIEGEEESGSPHFADLLREQRDRLACDVVVVSDTSVFGRDTPSICTGMRGLLSTQIDIHGPDIDLHSGSFGGAVPNPLTVLARMLAGLHDDDGRVTLPGFYDRVVTLTDRERELFARLPFDEQQWVTGTARSMAPAGEAGFSTLERLWARPTAEINGMWGGYTGPGDKTIVPTDAHAKVTFRLVTDQRPGDILQSLRAYVETTAPRGVTATVTSIGGGVRPCLTPLDHPALQAATRAMERAFGKEVLYTREGGSGPEADLAEILAAPVLFVGVGLPDDRIHAPNERVVLPMLEIGARAAAYLWEELARPAAATLST
jgi:acetylornithine deacetylase/succinyl-diaminopimelate desuccinylase-like protein